MAADCAEYALDLLRATSAVTDLVMAGEDGIFESGDLDMTRLSEIEEQRRQDATPGLVLAVVVQDAGAEAESEIRHRQRVRVWVYDRQRGYTNIRTMRKQVYLALQGRTSALTDPLTGRSVMVGLLFQNRTGHRFERRMNVEFENILFASAVDLDHG